MRNKFAREKSELTHLLELQQGRLQLGDLVGHVRRGKVMRRDEGLARGAAGCVLHALGHLLQYRLELLLHLSRRDCVRTRAHVRNHCEFLGEVLGLLVVALQELLVLQIGLQRCPTLCHKHLQSVPAPLQSSLLLFDCGRVEVLAIDQRLRGAQVCLHRQLVRGDDAFDVLGALEQSLNGREVIARVAGR